MRKVLASIVLGASLAVIGAGSVFAAAPHHQFLSLAACNPGTASARVISGNLIVPMYMASSPIGCMTMPGAFHP